MAENDFADVGVMRMLGDTGLRGESGILMNWMLEAEREFLMFVRRRGLRMIREPCGIVYSIPQRGMEDHEIRTANDNTERSHLRAPNV